MQCPKQLWLDAHKPELKVIPEKTQLRLDRGNDFGDRARAMFGPFVEVTEYIPNTKYLDKRKMVQNTKNAIPSTIAGFSAPWIFFTALTATYGSCMK